MRSAVIIPDGQRKTGVTTCKRLYAEMSFKIDKRIGATEIESVSAKKGRNYLLSGL
jgi:hypothetical protein